MNTILISLPGCSLLMNKLNRLCHYLPILILLVLQQNCRAESPYWRTRPGGLASVSYQFPQEPVIGERKGYQSLEFFIRVDRDPGNRLDRYEIPQSIRGTDSYIGYYWANQFAFANSGNGVDGYFGIQIPNFAVTLRTIVLSNKHGSPSFQSGTPAMDVPSARTVTPPHTDMKGKDGVAKLNIRGNRVSNTDSVFRRQNRLRPGRTRSGGKAR